MWNHWENYLGGLRLNWENYLSGLRRRRMEMLAACSTQAVEGLNSLVQRMSSSSPSISLPLLDSRVGMRHSSSSTFRQTGEYAAEYAAAVQENGLQLEVRGYGGETLREAREALEEDAQDASSDIKSTRMSPGSLRENRCSIL